MTPLADTLRAWRLWLLNDMIGPHTDTVRELLIWSIGLGVGLALLYALLVLGVVAYLKLDAWRYPAEPH